MSPARSRMRAALPASVLAVCCGCSGGSGGPSSTTEAQVHGTVVIDGKVPSKGVVVFDPTNINRPTVGTRQTTIAKDGTYSVTTLIGPNRITVKAPENRGDSSLQTPLFIPLSRTSLACKRLWQQ